MTPALAVVGSGYLSCRPCINKTRDANTNDDNSDNLR